MAFSKAALLALAASVFHVTQAWKVDIPPCISEHKPFVYSGCYQDGAYGVQTLTNKSPLDPKSMTPEKCMADCKGNGFRYAGIKHHGMCYCGNTVNGPQSPESSCNWPCNGNKEQICGGDNLLSIWQDPTFDHADSATIADYKSLGCYTDNASPKRALQYRAQVNQYAMTIEMCLGACQREGFPYAGTENGSKYLYISRSPGMLKFGLVNAPVRGMLVRNCALAWHRAC